MQAGQRRSRRVGVAQAGIRRPADCVAVQVEAAGDLVSLVAEIPAPQHGLRPLTVGQPHHGRDRQSARPQVSREVVLGRELLRGADADVVALDEDHRVAVPDQGGGRHRPRAAPGHHGPAAKAARVAAAQDAEQLVVGEREPVGFGQVTAHAVDSVRALAHGLRRRRSGPDATATKPWSVCSVVVTATAASLRRHYPDRFRRSVARSSTLSARSARAPVRVQFTPMVPVARPRPLLALAADRGHRTVRLQERRVVNAVAGQLHRDGAPPRRGQFGVVRPGPQRAAQVAF